MKKDVLKLLRRISVIIIISLTIANPGYGQIKTQSAPVLKAQPNYKINNKVNQVVVPPELSRMEVVYSSFNKLNFYTGQVARIRASIANTCSVPVTVKVRYKSFSHGSRSGQGQSNSNPSVDYFALGAESVIIQPGQLFVEFNVTAPILRELTDTGIEGWVNDTNQIKSAGIEIAPCDWKPTISVPGAVRSGESFSINATLTCPRSTVTKVFISSSLPNIVLGSHGAVIDIPAGSTSGSYTTIVGNATTTTTISISSFVDSYFSVGMGQGVNSPHEFKVSGEAAQIIINPQ